MRIAVLWLWTRNRNLVLVSPIQLSFPLHVIKYATIDELHENDPGLSIDLVPNGENGHKTTLYVLVLQNHIICVCVTKPHDMCLCHKTT